MTDPQKIRKLAALEERILQAFEAVSAILDDDDALHLVRVPCLGVDAKGRDVATDRDMRENIEGMKRTAEWALKHTRRELHKMGAVHG